MVSFNFVVWIVVGMVLVWFLFGLWLEWIGNCRFCCNFFKNSPSKTDRMVTKPTVFYHIVARKPTAFNYNRPRSLHKTQKTDRLHKASVGYETVGYVNQGGLLPQTRPTHNRPHITDRGRRLTAVGFVSKSTQIKST